MIKLFTFASEFRINALLCSSAAVLLSACGGAAMDQPSAAQEQAVVHSAGQLVSANPAPDPASATVPSADPLDAPDSAAAPTEDEFNIVGYGHAAQAADSTAEQPTMLAPSADAGAPAAQVGVPDTGASWTAPGTSYKLYVSPSGNDANAGTKAAPFRTLARAARSTRAGTTVFVAPGTYAGGIKTTVNGSAGARIYFVSTTRWGAKIVPPASSSSKVAWDNRGNYVDIVGFEVDGRKAQGGTRWLTGIYNGGSYDMIRNNWVHHIAQNVPCTSAGGSAIGVDSYFKGVKSDVIGNLVHDIGPTGCRFVQGIYISTSGTVKNNLVYRVAEGAIHLWHDANNVIISNNTVVASNTGIIIGGGDFYHTSGPNDNTHVYNNIVYDNKMGISEQGRTGSRNTYSNNLVYQNSTYNWKLNNGLTHRNTVTSAPLFVGYGRSGQLNLSLSRSSPAIGRGVSTHALTYDFLERPRNYNTGFDIGAYQQ